ncbi:MAG TPA: nuclear transport factor 2 family protein [Pyrinomonadaceae bacterium]|jgi:ketosteroid isomerase-like protein|nr:nuclear transport factor 2 family protein [Pyrinomonadaceae bacterium]
MRKTLKCFLAFATGALVFTTTPTVIAQEKKGGEQKPDSTADAWRRALPPEAETERPASVEDSSGTPARPSREEIERSLLALETKWMDALKHRDASTLGQVVADDFVSVSPRAAGVVSDRTKYLDHALRELKLTSYEFQDLSVRLYGRMAIVSGRLTQTASAANDENLGGSYFFTDVWVSRDGAWRVVSRHASPLTAAK